MKLEKKLKRTIEASVIIFAVGILLGAVITYAVTPSSTFYISSGVYPGAPSYTIWTDDTNYFAKDENGQLKYSGTNASQIIQNCIGENRKVFLMNGTYTLTLQGTAGDKYALQTPYSNFVLSGEGSGTVLKLDSGEAEGGTWDSIIRVGEYGQEKSGIAIENLKIDGNKAGQTLAVKGILILGNTKDSAVRNCELQNVNSTTGAIYCRMGSKWNTIQDNLITGSLHAAVYGEGCSHYTVTTNTFKDNGGEGVFFGTCNNTIISGNLIENVTKTSCHGIYINTVTDATITGNIIKYCGSWGIHVGALSNKIVVQANVIENNAKGGIYCQDVAIRSGNVVIDGNTINGNGGAVTGDGINLYYYYHVSVTNNLIFNNSERGINVGGLGKDITVDGNVVYDNGWKTADTYSGILVHQTATGRVIISNNMMSNTTSGGGQKYGIKVASDCLGYVIVDGNIIYDQTASGIIIQQDNCTVTSNICLNNANGITIGKNFTVVCNNRCSLNSGHGIFETGTVDYNIFVANNCLDNTGVNFVKVTGANSIYEHNLE